MEYRNSDAQRIAAISAIRSVLRPPPDLTVSEWADKYRFLSAESSSEPGRWSTDRAPYQREIMDTYVDPEVTDVTWVASAQVGKTEVLNNIIGYAIDQRPGPMLHLQPTLDMGQAWSKDRLAPMARDTPVLAAKIKINAKDGENTILHKKGPGWQLTIAGSNSPASLASRPIRDVFADEVDRYDTSAGKEGDPLKLAFKRTNNFWNRKRYRTSTPTVQGASRVMDEWELSDQRSYHVPCPHCGALHTLQWENVHWDKTQDEEGRTLEHHPETAYMACPECGGIYHDRDKALMLAEGRWIAAKPFRGHAGFHINELYSPWRRFRDVVQDFLDSKDNPETLKVWVNTSLGLPFEEDAGEQADPEVLLQRLEAYPAEVPQGAQALVAGVDVQNDRLEVQVDGYACDGTEEAWLVDYVVLYGDPQQQDVWDELEQVLSQTYQHESGLRLGLLGVCIDSGHHTQMVYEFCRTRIARRIYPIKGIPGEGRPFVAEAKQKKRGTGQRKTPLFLLGVDDGKAAIISRLRVDAPGPAYRHYPAGHPNVTIEYFRQLTAEKRVKRYKFGKPYFIWQQTRPRNEALDTTLYALAAFRMLPKHMLETAIEAVQNRGAAPERPKFSRTRGTFRT